MFTSLLKQYEVPRAAPKEGDLYKIIKLFGKTFELRYGYYEEFERVYNEPMPLYPDFIKNPMYTEDGAPFVTKMQDVCQYYTGPDAIDRECVGCRYYKSGEEFLGICTCPHNQIDNPRTDGEAHDR